MFTDKRYNSISNFYAQKFNQRVQKIAVDAGFTCPNRDGTKSVGGCIYCDNKTFKPFYSSPQKSIKQQLEEGIAFFSKKYKTIKYLAYFQAYTNTYAPIEILKKLYLEALSADGIIGLVISTRPDCIDAEKLDFIEQLSKKYFISMEYGVESTHNKTLENINRAHTFEEAKWAIIETSKRNIHTGAHFILGLPNENEEDILQHAEIISQLPIDSIKLHQLQIIKNTKLAAEYLKNPENFKLFSIDEYVDLVVKFVERLNPDIMIERFSSESPLDLLIAPLWGGLKNFEIVHKIEKRLNDLDTRQGKYYQKT